MKELWELVRERARERGLLNACLDLYRWWAEGGIELEDPLPPRSFLSFLARLDYSLWLWITITLPALTVAIVAATEAGFTPLMPLRYLLGTIVVLFLPGYALVEAIYPRGDELTPLERLALSLGLSLALVPLVGLALNYTPFGIRLYPVLASLTLSVCAMAFIGALRKYRYVSLLAGGASVGAR